MDEIQKLRSEATYVDTASFTLDALKARAKLAEFQLPGSGLWLVKLVQAAVAFKAPGIQIQFARNAVSVRFEADGLPSAEELLEQVMGGQSCGHLVTALRSCAGALTESVEWHSGGVQVKMNSASTRSAPSSEGGFVLVATRPPRTRSFSRALATSVSHLVRNTAEEYEAVAERCWVCPIPILLDGRPLQRGYDSPLARGLFHTPGAVLMQYEKSRARLPTLCVGVRQIPALPDRPSLSAMESHAELHKPVYKQGTFLRWQFEGDPVGAALTLQAYRGCGHRIDFVLDGAVVSSFELELEVAKPKYFLTDREHHVGLRLIFAVNADEVDLSQFEVRDKARLAAQLLEQVKAPLLEFLQGVLKRVPELYYLPFGSYNSKAFGLGMGAYTLGGAALVGIWFLAPIGVAAGGISYAHLTSCRQRVQKAIQAIQEALQNSERSQGHQTE
ncbi:MAG: hypothetical protein J0I12_17700 [Candidatus Eremiobacteraeota bacterium]|nr:hypothetical protein [Candidatus Eremiobacteraeota bacterium]